MKYLYIFQRTIDNIYKQILKLFSKSEQLNQELTDLRMREPLSVIIGRPSIQLTENEIKQVRRLLK